VRDPGIVEAELADIAAIQDDITKAERIVVWAAIHPDEVAFAIRLFRGRNDSLWHWARQHDPEKHPVVSNDNDLPTGD
jgi:hypothetical protein